MSPGTVALLLFGVFFVLIILRIPVAFALALACVPVFFIDSRLTPILLLQEMFKSYNSFVLLAVPFFLLAANLMNAAGITDRLINLARTMVGHLPGGLGHINVLVSMFFAGISGSSTADAAGIGSLLIPQMKKEGFPATFTVAITACSSVMGVIIPPSILMVVFGGLMSVSIGGMFLAGVVPGILIGLVQMLVVFVFAKRNGWPVYPRATLLALLQAVLRALLPMMTPLIIVGGIVGGLFTPTEASVVAVLYSLALGMLVYRTVGPSKLAEVLYETGRFAAISLFCIGTASAFGWILAYFQDSVPDRRRRADHGPRRHRPRPLHRRPLSDRRLLHRRHSGDHHRRYGSLPGGPGGRHEPDPLRTHQRHLPGLRAGDAALWPLPADLGGDRRDPRPSTRSRRSGSCSSPCSESWCSSSSFPTSSSSCRGSSCPSSSTERPCGHFLSSPSCFSVR